MGVKKEKCDFSGWATRNDVVCSDGRVIKPGAFAHNDKKKVPIFWQHIHSEIDKVLGHAILENRDEGVYAYAYLNDTYLGQTAKKQIQHGDLTSLSIHAVQVQQIGDDVVHGNISEVSLVRDGANPGAYIENINLSHSEGSEVEVVIYTGENIKHSNTEEEETLADDVKDKEGSEATVAEVLESMTDEQKAVTVFLVDEALKSKSKEPKPSKDVQNPKEPKDKKVKLKDKASSGKEVEHSDTDKQDIKHSKDGQEMARNVFDQSKPKGKTGATFTHAQMESIIKDVPKHGGSLKQSVLFHAQEYGIENIEMLFPETRNLTNTPEFISRQTEWVKDFLGSIKKTPFSRVKTIFADITADEARARGYVKNTLKKEEVFALLKRTTTPGTIYKKQKLDRDDILDITEFDVVIWIKAEMRLMLEEELARAVLMGDGRAADDEGKIQDPTGSNNGAGIRSIVNDDDMYSQKITLPVILDAGDYVDHILRSRVHYRGSGTPNFYTTDSFLTEVMMTKDRNRRRIYKTVKELADALRVGEIVPVEAMEYDRDLVGVIVNPRDYTIGADKGGETSFFDDFDIDWNQYKYLLETRLSGALTKPKSAIILKRAEGSQVVPTMPGFDTATNTLTIPTVTGVDYFIDDVKVTGTVVIEENTEVVAQPAEGHMFPINITTSWTYTFVG